MDSVQTLINKLAAAASDGEDNIALLELVEEIKLELLAKEPILLSNIEASSVSVMLPQGFRIKSATPPVSRTSTESSKLYAPKPPSIISESIEVALTAVLAESQPSEDDIIEKVSILPVPEPEKVAQNFVPATLPIVDEVGLKDTAVLNIHTAWMPALPIEETMELPITEEMVHEAVALENLANIPETITDANPTEMPVVLEKVEPQDLNQKLAQRSKALNEIFTKKEPVLAEVLLEPRISDLRKAISINEKYQYIDSLFRGDEQMFERSIKTLNNFGILPEAQYWMQRELLIKLGWNDNDELVQRFITLVSRRFS